MQLVFFARILWDLSLYFSLANFLAALFGGGLSSVAPFLILGFSALGCSVLSQKAARLRFGPLAGLAVEVVKNLLFFASGKSTEGIVGVVANLAAGGTFVLVAGLAAQFLRLRWGSADLKVEMMEVPALAISSTDIRERFAQRRPVRYLLPEAVAMYVQKNRLYGGSS
jgi:hypothetical protein